MTLSLIKAITERRIAQVITFEQAYSRWKRARNRVPEFGNYCQELKRYGYRIY